MAISKGFNLWKSLVVLGIVGGLAILAFPQLTRVAKKGEVAQAKSALAMLRKAEGVWFAKHSIYTIDQTKSGLAKENPEIARLASNDKDWFYSISANPDLVSDFLVTAIRKNGPQQFNGLTITINRMGKMGGTHPLKDN